MIKKRTAVIITLCIVLLTCTLTAGLTLNYAAKYMANNASQTTPGDYTLLDQVRSMFNQYSLNPPKDEDLLVGAAKGMVANAGDKYAQYFTPEEYDEFAKEQKGNYVGIGVTVQLNTDSKKIIVTNVIKDSPAAKGGILPGDTIVMVDDKDVTDLDVDGLADLIKGEENTDVKVGVLHSDGTQQEMTLTRKTVTEERVTASMISGTIGYVRITSFAGDAATKFTSLVKNLIDKQGCKAIVLDLRNNPGGDKDIVCAIADLLFPEGPIIIREDRSGKQKIDYSDSSCLNIPLVVLANEYSASASELLIAGIQDYKVGTFIGTTTYGKGVVQTFLPMPDGQSVIKLTTDRYLTPNGRSIQDVGCTPDIELKPSKELTDNPILMGTDQDNQLQAAINFFHQKGIQ